MIWIADVGCRMSDVRSRMSDVGCWIYKRGFCITKKKLRVTLWFYNLDFFNHRVARRHKKRCRIPDLR
jgi:hypothetical protein